MTANEILEFFMARSPWIDRATTVDRVIIGDGDKPVERVLVTWMPSMRAVRAAIDGHYDLLLTHEPTFYDHRDHRDDAASIERVAVAREKKRLIDDAGLVVVRNHDCWDLFPDIGVPFTWARHLGVHGPPVKLDASRYMHRYDIEPVPLETFARRVVARTKLLGDDAVQVFGRGDQVVSRVGIGTGCATDPATFQAMGCDVSIVSDDGTWYWKQLQRAEDEGHPFIRVHHGTSEEPGMQTLTQYVNDNVPGVRATYLPHRPFYRTVTA